MLRIALLVARADGHVRPEETQAVVQALPGTFQDMSERDLRALMEDAVADVAKQSEDEVMDHVMAALPDHGSRVAALKVACLVASADQLLSWRETSYLSRLADRLGLSRRDVRQVVRAVG